MFSMSPHSKVNVRVTPGYSGLLMQKKVKINFDNSASPPYLSPMIDFNTFILAGNATFTVTSLSTGTRFTFRVRQPQPTSPHFVQLLSGPDNESSYTFLGSIFNGVNYFHGRRSTIGPDAPSAKAFSWLWQHRTAIPLDRVSIHHEGKCCRCGRKLTVPSSIESGIGPECASIMGM